MSTTNPYTPGAGDVAVEMLREVFGKALDGILGSSSVGAQSASADMLGTAFGVFNGGVLFFGAIILSWVTMFGVANTANDGQVLGKKWSTFYTPLRTLTASSLLIPGASGYSGVQLLILLITTWSVGFASTMWSKVVDQVVDGTMTEQILRSVVDDKAFDKIALNAFQMSTCGGAVSQGISRTTGNTVQLRPFFRYQQVKTGDATTTYKTSIDFRDPTWVGSEEICGGMVLTTTFTKPDTNRASVGQATATMQNQIADLQGAVGNIRYKAVMGIFEKVAPEVIEVVRVAESNGGVYSSSRLQSVIDQARGAMLADVRAEVSKQIGQGNAGLKDQFKAGGWVMAGSLHRELVAVKDAIQRATTSQVQFVPGTYSVDHILGGHSEVSSAVNLIMSRYTSLAGFAVQKVEAGGDVVARKPTDMPTLRSGFGPEDFADGGTSVKSRVESYFNSLANWAMSGMVFYLAEDGSDPVMQVKNIGDYMATFAETVLLSKAALVATVDGLFEGSKTAASQSILGTNISGLLSVGPGVLKFVLTGVQELWSVISPGVMAMLYGGFFLGMWLPMVPFYIFALGVVGWLIQVVEALAAGSLWTVMHLTPEGGDSFIGSQQQGYLLLMSLFARPALMVLGLVASIGLLSPSIRYINAGFMTSFRVIQADSVTGILSVAGFMLIYAFIVAGVFMMVFSLPQALPDRVLRWVGAGIGDLGEQNSMSRIESGASGQAKAAALAGAAGLAGQAKDRKERELDAARKVNLGENGEADGAKPEGHTP